MPDTIIEPLHFASPVILVGASPVQIDDALAALPSAWPLIAADGGAKTLLALGRMPEAVIGDMDSLSSPVGLADTVKIIALNSQDDTDFEKCLARVMAPLVVGLGFLEGRFDHSLAAMHALMCLDHARPVMLIGGTDVVVRLRGDFQINLPVGSRFSIWPLGTQSFWHSTGLRWPLDGLTLAPGQMIGTSNEVVGPSVSIAATPGDGYAVIGPVTALSAVLATLLAGS